MQWDRGCIGGGGGVNMKGMNTGGEYVSTISLRFRYFAQIQIWTPAIVKSLVFTEKDQDDNNNKLSGNILGYRGGYQ